MTIDLFAFLKKNLKYTLEAFMEVSAPRHCLVCGDYTGDIIARFEFICPKCSDSMPIADTPDKLYNRLVSKFNPDDLDITNVFALFTFHNDIRYASIIHALKYKGFRRVGEELGKELGYYLLKNSNVHYDVIVPIPIHLARKRERGFNQSEEIARSVGQVIGTPVRTDLVKRAVYTRTQTMLSAEERMNNVKEIFVPCRNAHEAKNKYILLIDDVLTTGSTLNSCANSLMVSGAKAVDAAALAAA